ncbi:uncharacterized protein KY384_003352 [Bacidia gigantensis]|uniref:uncharacterized protein n=1 Tax=Bacidia gigantensis TaxID=2732470 RepID=UPI001D042F93|nr:uncharacterized protein KY384_003352 [Bacidia gigantensis]KAG8531720.1 hypothetical protein KY384_003352 [Bacidia gigantensis]
MPQQQPDLPISHSSQKLTTSSAPSNPQTASPPITASQTSQWTVESALSSFPLTPSFKPQPSTPIPFFHLLERLKTTPREGWRRFHIKRPESIADHMYRMSIICLVAPDSLASKINIGHCVQLALVHDMAESIVGDLIPRQVEKEEKARREGDTMAWIQTQALGGVDGGEQGGRLKKLWEEYEEGKTENAKFVKDVDKLELVLQMVEYEKAGEGSVDLGEFLDAKELINGDVCKGWAEELIREREDFWRRLGKCAKGMEGYVEEKKEEPKEVSE